MKQKNIDPDGYSPNDIVDRLHRCIDSGIYGMDYTILARNKNEEFYQNYCITQDDRIAILRGLTAINYDGWELSDEPNPGIVLLLFHFMIKNGYNTSPQIICD